MTRRYYNAKMREEMEGFYACFIPRTERAMELIAEALEHLREARKHLESYMEFSSIKKDDIAMNLVVALNAIRRDASELREEIKETQEVEESE